jgi:hypothetical protein
MLMKRSGKSALRCSATEVVQGGMRSIGAVSCGIDPFLAFQEGRVIREGVSAGRSLISSNAQFLQWYVTRREFDVLQ